MPQKKIQGVGPIKRNPARERIEAYSPLGPIRSKKNPKQAVAAAKQPEFPDVIPHGQLPLPGGAAAAAPVQLTESEKAVAIEDFLNTLWHLDVRKDHEGRYNRNIVNSISAGSIIGPGIPIPNHSNFWSQVIEFDPLPVIPGIPNPNIDVYDAFINMPINTPGSFRIKPTGQYYHFIKLDQTPKQCGPAMKIHAQNVYNYFSPPEDNPRKMLNIFTDTTNFSAEMISDFDAAELPATAGFAHIHTREIEADPALKVRAENKPGCPPNLQNRFWCEKVDANKTNKVIHYPRYTGVPAAANEQDILHFKKTQFFCKYDLFIKMENNPNDLIDRPDVFMSYKRPNGSTVLITENMNKAGGFDKLNELERQLAGVADDDEALEAVFVSKHAGDILQVLGPYAFPKKVVNFADQNQSRTIGVKSNDSLNVIETIDSPLFITLLLLALDACIFYLTIDLYTRHVLLVKRATGPIAGNALVSFYKSTLRAKQQQLQRRYAEIETGIQAEGKVAERTRIREYVTRFHDLLDEKFTELDNNIPGLTRGQLNDRYKTALKDLATFAYYSRCIPKGFLPNDDAVPILTVAELAALNENIDVLAPAGQAEADSLAVLQARFSEYEGLDKKLNDFPAEFLKICEDQIFIIDDFNKSIMNINNLDFEADTIKVVPEIQVDWLDLETEAKHGKFYTQANIECASITNKSGLRSSRQKIYNVWYGIHYFYFICSLFEMYDINYRNKTLYLFRNILETFDEKAPAGVGKFARRNFDSYLTVPPFTTSFRKNIQQYVMLQISTPIPAAFPILPPLPNADEIMAGGGGKELGEDSRKEDKSTTFHAQLVDVDKTLEKIEKIQRGEPLYPKEFLHKQNINTSNIEIQVEKEPTGIYATSGYMKYFHDFVDSLRSEKTYKDIETTYDIPLLLKRYDAALALTDEDFPSKQKKEIEKKEIEEEILIDQPYETLARINSTKRRRNLTTNNIIRRLENIRLQKEESNLNSNSEMTPIAVGVGGSKRKTIQKKRHITKKKSYKPRRRQTSRKRKA